jgi:hypothetical protein
MKKLYFKFFSLFLMISSISCNKEQSSTSDEVIYNMIANKIWYLDYSITGSKVQNYVGQSTYFITFLKNRTTNDSDGLIGSYAISYYNNAYLLQVNARTVNGNSISYSDTIESVGDVKMVLSYISTGQTTKTTMYFTNRN